jgi:hypothetical protein
MIRSHRLGTRAIVFAVACILGASAAGAAQATLSAPARLNAVEQKARDAVLARYRALSIQNGIVLVPLTRTDGIDSIELRGGAIAINSRAATGSEIRDRLGRDAEAILQLSYFDLATQQRILLAQAPPESAGTGGGEVAVPQPPSAAAPPEPPAPPVPERPFRRDYDARVRILGDITVAKDEQVNGAVVAVGGSVKVDGRVRDDVVAVGGSVKLGPHAEVLGDVTSVGGTIERDPGAVVSGRLNEVAFSTPNIRIRPRWNFHLIPWYDTGAWPAFRLLGTAVRMALVGLLAALIVLIAPRGVRRVEHVVTTEPWKAAAVGLLAELFFIPALVLAVVALAISIIGIPLLVLVPFAVLAFFVALLLGFAGAACSLAGVVWRRASASGASLLTMLGVGLVVVWSLTLLGRVIGLAGGPFVAAAVVLIFVGVLVEFAVWTVGLGGALLTRFGRYGALPAPPVAPAPPADPAPLSGEVL